jgi:hypothetical protein
MSLDTARLTILTSGSTLEMWHLNLAWLRGKASSLCRFIRRPEHLIRRQWCLSANWRSFIWWSPDQCYAIECYRSYDCALFCVFMTRLSQCPISLRSVYPGYEDIFCWMERGKRVFINPD